MWCTFPQVLVQIKEKRKLFLIIEIQFVCVEGIMEAELVLDK
jgi:hypothetical protein